MNDNYKSQLERFKEAARDLGADEPDDAIDRVMGKLDLARKLDNDLPAPQDQTSGSKMGIQVMFTVRLMCAALVAFTPLSANAQDESQAPRCWFLSKSFSPGSALRVGNAAWVCTTDSSWQPVTDRNQSSGCFAEDKFFSTGGVYEAGKSGKSLTCSADGSWYARAPEK